MKSLDVLQDEHRGIEAMLSIVEAAASHLERGGEVDPQVFAGAVDFFQNFADGCHHAKEEETLFPLLATRGLTADNSAVGALLAQHNQGRACVGDMRAAAERLARGDRHAREALSNSARAYAKLLRVHIEIEEAFFSQAAQILSVEDDQRLVDQFEVIEDTRTGRGEHERYHRMIADYQQVVAGW